jgi:hypothetical protein
MNKTQKIKQATKNTRKQNFKQLCKKIVLFPVVLWKRLWNWLKSIDIVGMVNLTLLVAIIVLFSSLISDVMYAKPSKVKQSNVVVVQNSKPVEKRKVVQRKFNTNLPLRADKQTGITPKIRTVGVKKPEIIRELSVPAHELPTQQNLSGDVIVDIHPASPVLQNGVNINGNLFIQNMRKYTLPCGTKIKGNLFVRNVDKLYFCGDFTVKGNIYVNRQSSFGPIPQNAQITGNIIL